MADLTSVQPTLPSIPLQNQSSSHQLSVNHQPSTADSSIVQANTSPPLPNCSSAQFMVEVPSLAQSNPSTPSPNHGSAINFVAELPLSHPIPSPDLGLNQYIMAPLAQPNLSVPPPNQDSNNQLNQAYCPVIIQPSSEVRPILSAYQGLNLQDSNKELNQGYHAVLFQTSDVPPIPSVYQSVNPQLNPFHCIHMVEPPFSQPNSSTVLPPTYSIAYPLPSVSPPPLNQGSNPMIGPSFGDQPNSSTVPPQHNMKETQQIPVSQPSAQPKLLEPAPPPPPPSPNHSSKNLENRTQPLPSLPEPMPAPVAPVRTRGLHTQKVANTASNLANLLPTGTVLAFQALIPSLSNSGQCDIFHKYLVGFVIAFCAATCFISSFTDSFEFDQKLYYGFATCKGLCIFNYENRGEEEERIRKELKNFKIEVLDFIHAFGSLFVFLIFAISSSEVLTCFFPEAGEGDKNSIVVYLPLVAGVLSSFLFTIFPTKRKGFGYTDNARRP